MSEPALRRVVTTFWNTLYEGAIKMELPRLATSNVTAMAGLEYVARSAAMAGHRKLPDLTTCDAAAVSTLAITARQRASPAT